MAKNIRKKTFFILLCILVLLPNYVSAQYIRENSFLDKQGVDRIAEIKRFQAENNLEVTGVLNDATKDMLYNESKISYDIVDKPPTDGYWIVINKSRRFLTLYKSSEVAKKYPVAIGKQQDLTPSIKTKIVSKIVNPAWNGKTGRAASGAPGNPLGKRWLGLIVGNSYAYGIHGNANTSSIGTNASLGCIRMFNYDIETYLFPTVPVGTPVWIGNDNELAKWGVRQIIDLQNLSNNEESIEKPENENNVKDKDIENSNGLKKCLVDS
ncbi:MAG: murein L,D-transpeptidase [Tissierellia bacterium]|nr:murein L,D-transpeptidase [Tissierellia bacterium]